MDSQPMVLQRANTLPSLGEERSGPTLPGLIEEPEGGGLRGLDNVRELQGLLSEQLVVVHRALAINRAVAKRLAAASTPLQGSPHSEGYCSEPACEQSWGSPYSSERLGPSLMEWLPPRTPRARRYRPGGSPGSSFSAEVGRTAGPATPLLRSPSKSPWQALAQMKRKTEPPTSFGHGAYPSLAQAAAQARKAAMQGSHLFPDADAMKDQVRAAVCKQEYNVEIFYKETGAWQSIARSSAFRSLTFAMIALNGLWIAVDTDMNHTPVLVQAPMPFQVIENLFCVFFSFEIIARFMAFRRLRDALYDAWFVFDSLLTLMMVWGTWGTMVIYLCTGDTGLGGHMQTTMVFRTFRIFRLTRIARLARLLRGVPELFILTKGMAMAMRSVFSTLCLLVIVMYFFAIVFTETLAGTEAGAGCFDTVPMAMNCLLLTGVFADQASFITKMLETGWTYYIIILVYMVVGSLCVLNMLIGVICEVVTVVAQVEKEELLVRELKDKISGFLQDLDTDHDKRITRNEFKLLIESPEAMRTLHEVNVDVLALVDYSEFIFRSNEELTFAEFIQAVLQFRGDNKATVKDVVDIRTYINSELSNLEAKLGLTH